MPSSEKVILKTAAEIAKMREAGRIVAQALHLMEEMVKPGVTTKELDSAVEELIIKAGGIPTFKDYPSHKHNVPAFPASICASVNEQVVHGIPGARVLKEGDVLSVDIGVHLDGWCGDAARTYAVGEIGRKAKKLLDVTENSLKKAIANCRPGKRLHDVSAAVQKEAESNGFSVVKQFVGHGIGRDMHEEPAVLHYGQPGSGMALQEGMVFTIEPMINQGDRRIKQKKDGWTVVTRDKKLSAQWEHTVAVTADGVEILTLRDEERRAGYAERY
jgi:methionine aminopeptidase, type I